MLAILVADTDPLLNDALRVLLTTAGHRVLTTRDRDGTFAALSDEVIDLVVCDVETMRLEAPALLRRMRRLAPEASLVLITRFPTVADAISAIQERAVDYLQKPIDEQRLLAAVATIAEARAARGRTRSSGVEGMFLGSSPLIARLRERIAAIADSDGAVLITGESGTGKELVARSIHQEGRRRCQPWVVVNCGALPPTLIEAELFGHERGAFTGAERRRDGRFLAAHGGTLFLDEIAELPLEAQVKLLRVLQEGTFDPLGSNKTARVDVRVLSATNQDLRALVAHGRFREDLYYRLRVFELRVPPLRERPRDLAMLVERFIGTFKRREDPMPVLSPAAWAAVLDYRFPGNVRELQNAINHAVTLARGQQVIDLGHLPAEMRGSAEEGGQRPMLSRAVERFEQDYIRRALAITGGQKKRAAELLGISRKCLYQKLGAQERHSATRV